MVKTLEELQEVFHKSGFCDIRRDPEEFNAFLEGLSPQARTQTFRIYKQKVKKSF
ncbi:MAG: hypothetical protein FWC79_00905 [Oscillospiraceae bacterium]|nr:hypothetical protein [Oscillospiraceae bacterium]